MTKENSIKYRYKFSFVMPVYNVERYLAETLDSVISQTIGFRENCQIILINDGSTDDSETVCVKYKNKYPDNIIYVKQKNSGVSVARNNGIKRAEGEYISFLDSDDLLSSNTLEEVYRFFDKNKKRIDIVAIKMRLFDAREGSHTLNYKFKEDRVIDITEDYSAIQSSGGPTFVKTSVAKQEEFDEQLKIAEDFKFITNIIIRKKKYGVLKEPTYWYRKRSDGSSATSNSQLKKYWYDDVLTGFHDQIIRLIKDAHNDDIKKYLGFVLMYEMQWRFTQQSTQVLSTLEKENYKKRIFNILHYIDDEVILAQRNLQIENKLYIISKKNDIDLQKLLPTNNGEFFYKNIKVYDYKTGGEVVVEMLEIKDNILIIRGNARTLLMGGARLGFKVGNEMFPVDKTNRPHKKKYFLDDFVFDRNTFEVSLPIKDGDNIQPFIYTKDYHKKLPIIYDFHARMGPYNGYRYRILNNYIICHVRPELLVIIKNTPLRHAIKELKLNVYPLAKKVWVK